MSETFSRRRFLRGAAATAAATALAPAPLLLTQERPDVAARSDVNDWRDVPPMFSYFTKPVAVPMNAANLCPAFMEVTQKVAAELAAMDDDCSLNRRTSDVYRRAMHQARVGIAFALNAMPQEIALVRNASAANNTIVNGVTLRDGDEVLLWDDNHETNDSSWVVRRQRGVARFEIKRVNIPLSAGVAQIVDIFRRAITPRTRVISFSEISNHTGMRLPSKQIAAMAHNVRRDIFVHVDGAQSWGALALDLHDMGCDSFSGSGHKWPCGPRESGILYVRCERVEQLWPNIVAYDINIDAPCWGQPQPQCGPMRVAGEAFLLPEDDVTESADVCHLFNDARRFELLGQRNDATIFAMTTMARLHDRIEATHGGRGAVERRIAALARRLKEKGPTSLLLTPMSPELSHGVVVFRADKSAQELRRIFQELYGRFGIAGNVTTVMLNGRPQGILRLCPHIYNTEEQVDHAASAVRALLVPGAAS
ncbi:MAG TPA: aminotransferase class V-fold PLP-dependent enzyme [Thermoanaerobaculia bacterium]|nr:aminotransferase class V-fold PLP-dependent enzyme [Thermoanaerobaculia bacterium]